MSAQLILYVDSNFLSPYAMSAFVGLKEKGLAFDMVRLNLAAREQNAGDYAAQSLTQRVPMLAHGDFKLSESSAITEYLEEEFAAPQYAALYPVDKQARAKARELQAWLRSDLAAVRQERSTEVVFRQPTDKPLSPQAQAAAAKLFAAGEKLLANGQEHLLGEWSIADVDFALMLNRLVLNGDKVPTHLAEYARRQWQRPSIQDWIALSQ